MLRADELRFAYGADPVVRDVTLAIQSGALVGILGPNGSGKTTLLKLLSGTLTAPRGRVRLDDTDLRRLSRAAIARRMAVVPQETHLAFDYTVLEIALMGRYPHLGAFAVEGPGDLAIARDALAETGTLALASRPFMTLSGGEKQRVVIASALAQLAGSGRGDAVGPPGVLLLDEPTASLDLAYQLEIAAILRRLNRDRGITIVVSTHDLNLAAGLCRELVLLRDGRVLASGATGEVLTPEVVRQLYGVEVDVRTHERTGRLTVVPVARAAPDAAAAAPPGGYMP